MKRVFFHKGTHIKATINFDIDADKVPNNLLGDEGRLVEILNHILENAAKFTTNPPEAIIRISTLEKTPEDVLLEFSITDKGIGIAGDYLEKIFEPFSQVDTSSTRQYDGAGMGLSVCQDLVIIMGGKIRVESQPGRGSTFSFTLRLKQHEKDDAFNFSLLEETKDAAETASTHQEEQLLDLDIEKLSPVIKNLSKAFSESDPQNIHAYLTKIKAYNLPDRLELLQRVDDYEYDEAELLLKEIAVKVGVQI